MYNTAGRFPQLCQEDASLVGPNSYFITKEECSKNKEYNFPFSSTTERFQDVNDKGAPSPAHYYPKYRKYRILGGKSLQNSAPRICIVPKKYKPQVSYPDPFMQQFTKATVSRTRSLIKKNRSSMFKHMFCVTKSEISEVKSPKILQKIFSNKSLPAYLKFPGETSKASLKYRGSRWGQYTSKRNESWKSSETPGPGTYNIVPERVVKKHPQPPVHEIRQRKCYPSYEDTQPALFEQSSKNEDKISHYFDGTCDMVYKKISHNKSRFGIWGKAQRFTFQRNENPPPWAYNLSDNQCGRKIVKLVPFACCSPRFKAPSVTDLSPASYSQIHKTIKEKMCDALPKTRNALVAPFGSTASRLAPPQIQFSDDEDEEDNQDYLIVTQALDTQETQDSGLKDTTQENSEDKLIYQVVGTSLLLREVHEEEPPAVDMRQIFNNWKGRTNHRRQVENEGFLSADYKRTEWMIAKTPAHDVDWRGQDDLKVNGGANKMDAPIYNKNPKVKQDTSVFYDLPPVYASSVYKPTHNYKLKRDSDIEKPVENPDNVKTILKCFMPKEILYA